MKYRRIYMAVLIFVFGISTAVNSSADWAFGMSLRCYSDVDRYKEYPLLNKLIENENMEVPLSKTEATNKYDIVQWCGSIGYPRGIAPRLILGNCGGFFANEPNTFMFDSKYDSASDEYTDVNTILKSKAKFDGPIDRGLILSIFRHKYDIPDRGPILLKKDGKYLKFNVFIREKDGRQPDKDNYLYYLLHDCSPVVIGKLKREKDAKDATEKAIKKLEKVF